jgi:hypothetical protein
MVGRSVLNQCIESEHVAQITVITRKTLGVTNPKVQELIHQDFTNFSSLEKELQNYDACFHCMGVSSFGMSEQDYTRLTYGITLALASTLVSVSPNMTMTYVSGTGADSTEKGSSMWARVKGKTENMLLNIGFKDAYMFRLGALLPQHGVKSKTTLYNLLYSALRPVYPLLPKLMAATTSVQLGNAMIHAVLSPQPQKILENNDINRLASDVSQPHSS